jgi:hypothetical protein
MKRRVIAAVWIAGATIPLLMAAVFLVGCCALPFHSVTHKLMPICEMAASVMRGEQADRDHDALPSSPAREKQEPVKRIATQVPSAFRLAVLTPARHDAARQATTSYRSFITLGAIRCDSDVGLHVLVEAFLL